MNARGLARFMFALRGDYLFPQQLVDDMTEWMPTGDDGIEYGLGPFRVDYTQFDGYAALGEVWGHDGWGGAFMYYSPQAHTVITGTPTKQKKTPSNNSSSLRCLCLPREAWPPVADRAVALD